MRLLHKELSRRRFFERAATLSVELAAGLAFGLGVGFVPSGCGRAPRRERLNRLLGLVPGTEGLAIGSAYLRVVGPANARKLAEKIIREPPAELFVEDDSALRSWLAERVRSDFEKGRIISVERWQLSRTEVTLCLLKVLHVKAGSPAPATSNEAL